MSNATEDRAWVRFQPPKAGAGHQAPPAISISSKDVYLTSAALALLGDPKCIDLLFDRGSRTIGIRAADCAAEGARHVSKTRVTSARGFAEFCGLTDLTGKLRLPARLDGDVLVADLHITTEGVA